MMTTMRPDADGASRWSTPANALGQFIRAQRTLANLSLREMAALTSVSNAYLSQVERGLHQPSLKVLRSIADALVVTEAAVKQHLLRLYQKFRIPEGPARRSRLANDVIAQGIVRQRPPTLSEVHDGAHVHEVRRAGCSTTAT